MGSCSNKAGVKIFFFFFFLQNLDTSKISTVSQQLGLVAEFQLKECAGIIMIKGSICMTIIDHHNSL